MSTDEHWAPHPAVVTGDARSFGERAADRMRAALGSWTFVFLFLAVMAVWMILNAVQLISHWDPYPYILLNLMLSTLAGLQGGILLIAAKRSDQIAAQVAIHTAGNTDMLIELLQQNTDLTKEIHQASKRGDLS